MKQEQFKETQDGVTEFIPSSKNFWLPTETGQTLEGKFIGFEKGTFGLNAMVEVGTTVFYLPNRTQLDEFFNAIEKGNKVRIVYNGKKGRLNDYKLFIIGDSKNKK